MAEDWETGYRRLLAAIEGIDDRQRLRVLIRTHLSNLLEGMRAPMLLFESRSRLTRGACGNAAITDRYQKRGGSLDAFRCVQARLKSRSPVRLLLFGMLNWTP